MRDASPLFQHIGLNLRAARVTAALTQAEVGALVALSPASIGAWERGHTTPNAAQACTLAAAYGITLDQLLGHPYPASEKGA